MKYLGHHNEALRIKHKMLYRARIAKLEKNYHKLIIFRYNFQKRDPNTGVIQLTGITRDMFTDIAVLVAEQHSLMSIIRYMIACFQPQCYYYGDRITSVFRIIPLLGSMYSQKGSISNAPITDMIMQHLQDDLECCTVINNCACESWKTILSGHIW